MLFADRYPNLFRHLNLENFELVAKIIHEKFRDWFLLDELEQADLDSSYGVLFRMCLEGIDQCFTETDIIANINLNLNGNDARDFMRRYTIFTHSRQLSYVESLASGRLPNAPQPLTALDLLRALPDCLVAETSILSLNTLTTLRPEHNKRFLFINLNKDSREFPKWAVVDRANNPINIYCETTLLLSDKVELKKILGDDNNFEYKGGESALSAASGYLALAWLNGRQLFNFNERLTLSADFYILVQGFVECLDQRKLSFFRNEVCEATDAWNNNILMGNDRGGKKVSLYQFVRSTILGVNREIGINNLVNALKLWPRLQTDFRNELLFNNARCFVPGLDLTLLESSADNSNDQYLLEDETRSRTLNIPSNISIEELAFRFRRMKNKHNLTIGEGALCHLQRNRNQTDSRILPDDIVSGIIISTFRSSARSRSLTINCPNTFSINQKEKQIIVDLIGDNPYLTQLNVSQNHFSLETLKENIYPFLSRNKWLNLNGYQPPLIADFWVQAAKYWIAQLSTGRVERNRFEECADGMGIDGLNNVLHYLANPDNREYISDLYGSQPATFYLPCDPASLENHLNSNLYFPYSALDIKWLSSNREIATYMRLLTACNNKNSIEIIRFVNIYNLIYSAELLNSTLDFAQNQQWTILISIPELDTQEALNDPDLADILRTYKRLNNTILDNRRKQEAELVLTKLHEHLNKLSADQINPFEYRPEDNWAQLINNAVESLPDDFNKFNLSARLQMQQQQTIEQKYTLEAKLPPKRPTKPQELPLNEENFVNYDNIVERLIKDSNDNISLRDHFVNWISATHTVDAPMVIKHMTIEAAQKLYQHRSLLTSGLHLDDLPKGFYTQRSTVGELVLCFSTDVFNNSTPLTLNLDTPVPVAEDWLGSFHQLGGYKNNIRQDIELIRLFAQMQANIRADEGVLEAFLSKNNLQRNATQIDTIKNNWPMYSQVWEWYGHGGCDFLLNRSNEFYNFRVDDVLRALLKDQRSSLALAKKYLSNEKSVRALGQVFYRYGRDGMDLFLQQLERLEIILGNECFQVFKDSVLNLCDNFNVFMSEKFLNMLEKMTRTFNANSQLKAVWQDILTKHYNAVGWDDVHALWSGFEFFVAELQSQNVSLRGDEFSNIPNANMLVTMSRILGSVRCIANHDRKLEFLSRLESFDLYHGGVYYALRYENYKRFGNELSLFAFNNGYPTYTPDISRYESWGNDGIFHLQRTLSSRPQFSDELIESLLVYFRAKTMEEYGYQLMWILHTQFDEQSLLENLARLHAVPNKEEITQRLFAAVYENNNASIQVEFSAMLELCASDLNGWMSFFDNYPEGTVLEAASIAAQKHANFDILNIFVFNLPFDADRALYLIAFKLVALLGQSEDDIVAFSRLIQNIHTENMKHAIAQEIKILGTQLLSIDYTQSNFNILTNENLFSRLIETIYRMIEQPHNMRDCRIRLIDSYINDGLSFKYSRTGNYRPLNIQDKPAEMSCFEENEERLWTFMLQHIVIPGDSQSADDDLKPIVEFLQQLQDNDTYINEIGPLLATLESTPEGSVWTAQYFAQLLKALRPAEDSQRKSYPLSILKQLLAKRFFAAADINAVKDKFPVALKDTLQDILTLNFTRNQQSKLCEIAVNEYAFNEQNSLLRTIVNLFANDELSGSLDLALDALLQCQDEYQLVAQVDECAKLLRYPINPNLQATWPQTTKYWLNIRNTQPDVYGHVLSRFTNEESQGLVLHIIANSCLNGDRKRAKLIDRLHTLDYGELYALATCYSQCPQPMAHDILTMIKTAERQHTSFAAELENYLRKPNAKTFADFGLLSVTRQTDLERMLVQLHLTSDKLAKLTTTFAYLKRFEAGLDNIYGCKLADMTSEQLFNAFALLKTSSTDKLSMRAQLWAVLFKIFSTSMLQYPHLAQQVALLAIDVGMENGNKVLKIATGEGKSHFIALRAAMYAGAGKRVDVCTAKRTLATRDLKQYTPFYSALNLTAKYIHPLSAREDFVESNICYSILGDVSLFLDAQSYNRTPVELDPDNRVALLDEFDFIFFSSTDYNYAKQSGRLPKEMSWFYKALNDFDLNSNKTLKQNASDFMHIALTKAGANERKKALLKSLLDDPERIAAWLDAVNKSKSLVRGKHYIVKEGVLDIGDESYTVEEVIPLDDNQIMEGSTFSQGTHQLVTTALNQANRSNGVHVPLESDIVSSRVASDCLTQYGHWEGVSGTNSELQTQVLSAGYNASVVQVPTNRQDLRNWKTPGFYDSEDERDAAIFEQIQQCLENRKSILFACKDDNAVQLLENKIKIQPFYQGYLDNFIFYYNEDKTTPEEILLVKAEKEEKLNGHKSRGVCFAASGFGRGDNVDVEYVFLMDVNDENDRLQKGGRTARNGAEGTVLQFYLKEQLYADCNTLDINIDDSAENLLAKVLRKKEKRKYFDELSNNRCRNYVSQYSAHGMQFIAGLIIEDPKAKELLERKFIKSIPQIDDRLKLMNAEEQQAHIQSKFVQFRQSIESLTDSRPSDLYFYKINENLQAIPGVEEVNANLVKIHLRFIHLANLESVNLFYINQFNSIIDLLDDIYLPRIVNAFAEYNSLETWVNYLESFTVENYFSRQRNVDENDCSRFEVWIRQYPDLRQSFELQLTDLARDKQEAIITWLMGSHGSQRLDNLQHVLLLMPAFRRMGIETIAIYLNVAHLLAVHTIPEVDTAKWLENVVDMDIAELLVIQRLVATYSYRLNWVNNLTVALKTSIYYNSSRALRMLSQCETWLNDIPAEDRPEFLIAFCYLMDNLDDDTLTSLIAQTQKSKQPCTDLWVNLAVHSQQNTNLNRLITYSLGLPGKSWSTVPTKILATLSPDLLAIYQNKVIEIYNILLADESLNKQAKLNRLEEFMRIINDFHNTFSVENALLGQFLELPMRNEQIFIDLINYGIDNPNKMALILEHLVNGIQIERIYSCREFLDALTANELNLPDSRYNGLIATINANLDILRGPQDVFATIINYYSGRLINLNKATQLSALLIDAVRNEPGNSAALIARVDDLIDQPIDSILRLQASFPDAIGMFLFDQISQQPANQVMDMVVARFYHARTVANTEQLVTQLTNFDDPNNYASRIWLMRLLKQEAFITAPGAVNAFQQADNNRLFGLGLTRYSERVTQILNPNVNEAFNVNQNRRLTRDQRTQLLQVADEMRLIGDHRAVIDADHTDLGQRLQLALTTYSHSWFKSSDRKQRLEALSQQIDIQSGNSNYMDILTAINDARTAALEADREANRSRFIKLHSNGQSRYLNTLNQMEDEVLRYWSQDINAIDSFSAYTALNQTTFVADVRRLREELISYFTRPSALVVEIIAHAHDCEDYVTHVRVNTMMEHLHNPLFLKVLPDHLKPLVDNVVERGNSIAAHLDGIDLRHQMVAGA